MKLILNGLIPAGEYGSLCRTQSGWIAAYGETSLPVQMPLPELGLDTYRLIGKDDGTAEVIRFADCHCHSDGSLQDSIIKVKDLVKHIEYAGALTNHGNMYDFLSFYTGMVKAGKKPIIGMEGYMIDSRETKGKRYHVILLAKNDQGYRNLVKLASESFAPENFYSKPLITWEMLEAHKEGIICLTACLAGIVPQALVNGDIAIARHHVEHFISIFGKEDFYIEIQNHHIADEDRIRPQLVALAKEYGLKYVATTDAHYVEEQDRDAHQIVLCLQDGKTINNPQKRVYDGEGYYLHTSEMMERRFAEYPEALDTSLEIAEKCNVKLDLDKVNLPNYQYPAPFANADEYMLHIAKQGFQERFEGTPHLKDPEYIQRFEYEANMIKQMGFAAYFVIIWDFINYARTNKIPVGPGRGSGAGSMVAYCMGITDMDPIKYKLLFERFLNPERVSMPDIDTDIAHVGRPQVFQYMVNKYGKENVCRIITFGTMAAKQVLKDVVRVLEYPVSVGNRLTAMLKDPKLCKTLDDALKNIPEFAETYENSEDDKRIIDLARRLEGCKRHASLHACGVVIAPSQVSDYMPTCTMTDDESENGERVVASQVEKEEVEKLSLIKMDLLGLKNLSAIDETLKSMIQNYGTPEVRAAIPSPGEDIRYQDIPLGDRATYAMLRDGGTGAVFQLESEGMTDVIKDMLSDLDTIPDEQLEDVAFERLIAAVALYRPGPMDYIPDYIAGLRDPGKVHYDCPEEEEILSSTYGVMVYQEQLMQIAQKLAGYSLGQADILRKACGKKKKDLMAMEHEKFVHGSAENNVPGCVVNGISEEVAEEIWAKMTKFAEYAFNRSHAACYAWLGYITAYLRCHYPTEFYAAMMNAFIGDQKCKNYLSQADGKGITLKIPDVQRSNELFRAEKDGILFGLQGIAGVNTAATAIVHLRNEDGQFTSLQDFYTRLRDSGININKKTMEGLIYAGALHAFSDNKAGLLAHYKAIESDYKANADMRAMGQLSLFSDEEQLIPMPTTKPMAEDEEIQKEFEALGIYLSKHPTEQYEEAVEATKDYTPLYQLVSMAPSKALRKTMGLVTGVKEFYTKRNNDLMAVFNLETKFTSVPCVIFPKSYEECRVFLKEGAVVCVCGTVIEDSKNEDEIQFSVQKLLPPDLELDMGGTEVVIDVHDKDEQEMVIAFVRQHPGNTPVVLRGNGKQSRLKEKVNGTLKNVEHLKSLSLGGSM